MPNQGSVGTRDHSVAAAPAGTANDEQCRGGAQAIREHAKRMLQVRGLLLEMDDLRALLRLRDKEIVELRRQLQTAEQLIGRR